MLDRIDVKYFKLAVGSDRVGRQTDVDISARCPICGDSQKKKSSKRLHLYTKDGKTGHVNCFNGDCSCQNKTMYSFLRDFYPALLPQYKRENFQNTMNTLSSNGNLESTEDDVFASFVKEQRQEITEKIKEADIVKTYDLSPFLTDLKESKDGLDYLSDKRGFTYNEQFGKWYMGHQDLNIDNTLYRITDSIVIPLYYNDKMYGFYSRSIKDKVFYTYMSDVNVGYKIWNWFNIDKNKPVYIFEGIFDAISSGQKNIIAAIGAKIPQARIDELSEPIFCYDNDVTGLNNSLKMAKNGYKVYVQPTNILEKDMNELMMSNPNINIQELIDNNTYSGILAELEIKSSISKKLSNCML